VPVFWGRGVTGTLKGTSGELIPSGTVRKLATLLPLYSTDVYRGIGSQPENRCQRRRNGSTGHSTGGGQIARAFVNCRSWAACRSRQPARPIQLIARNLLPSSRSEAGSFCRIH